MFIDIPVKRNQQSVKGKLEYVQPIYKLEYNFIYHLRMKIFYDLFVGKNSKNNCKNRKLIKIRRKNAIRLLNRLEKKLILKQL